MKDGGAPRFTAGERRAAEHAAESKEPLPDLTTLEKENVARLMEERPQQVMAAIDALENREYALSLAKFCANALQGPHFDLLVAWAKRQSDERFSSGIYSQFIVRWTRQDPAGCIAFGVGLGGSEEAMKAKDMLFWFLPTSQGLTVLEKLPEDQRGKLLALRAGRLASSDPVSGLKLICELQDTPVRQQALQNLMSKWAGEADGYHLADPAGAARNAIKITNPTLRAAGVRSVTTEWGRENPTLAERWTKGLAAGKDRDAAAQGMAQACAKDEPEDARQWAESIADIQLRTETLKKLQAP